MQDRVNKAHKPIDKTQLKWVSHSSFRSLSISKNLFFSSTRKYAMQFCSIAVHSELINPLHRVAMQQTALLSRSQLSDRLYISTWTSIVQLILPWRPCNSISSLKTPTAPDTSRKFCRVRTGNDTARSTTIIRLGRHRQMTKHLRLYIHLFTYNTKDRSYLQAEWVGLALETYWLIRP